MSSYIAHNHTMLCAPHTYYPWSLDLFIHVPLQLPFLEHATLAAILPLGTSRTYCHLCPTRYSFTLQSSEACEGRVPRPRTQHQTNVRILRGEKHDISKKNPATSEIQNCTTGSAIDKAPRSSQCATSLYNR